MNRRLVFAACGLTVFIAYAVRYGYGLLLPNMLNTLNITKTDAGVISSSFFIAYTLASPVCGFISDRYGSRVLLSTFVILLGIGTFLMGYATNVLQASMFFLIAGIGAAACWAPIISLAQKWASPERRGMTLSFLDIGSALGISVMAASVPVIVSHFNWQTGWMIMGVFALVTGVLNFFFVKNPPVVNKPASVEGSPKPAKAGLPISALLRMGKFWQFGFAYLLIGAAYIVPFTFLSTYAVNELSVSYTVASSAIFVLGLGAIVSKLVIGPISDKAGRLKMILLCSSLIGAGALVMANRSIVTLYIAAVIFSLGYGAIWAMYGAAASDYFDRESSGTIVGIWTIFLGAGAFLAPVISGWLADATGTLSWSFLMAGIVGVISAVILLPLLKKTTAK